MLVILSVLLILFQCATLSSSQPALAYYYCNSTYGNYTSNSIYQQNLYTLLSDISSNTKITYGFYNLSIGKVPNVVNGIGLCRGDLFDCRDCLKDASIMLLNSCSNQKQAIGWYDTCMLRFSNQSIFGVMEDTPQSYIRNGFVAVDPSNFNPAVNNLFVSLVNKAAEGNSVLKFAINKSIESTFVTVYAFAQCTPDVSQSDCYRCLSDSATKLQACCLPSRGVRYFRPSCNIRYEVYPFSNAFDTPANSSSLPPTLASAPPANSSSLPPTLASDPAPTPDRMGKGSNTSKIVAVVVAMTIVCLLLSVVICLCLRKDKGEWNNNELEEEDEISSTETLQIAYDDIKDATLDFAETNKLGRGGFGTVYKGVLACGREIAVKRLARNSMQGEAEFRNEVLLVAKLQHRNLVKLLGYSLAGEERLLVYEFVPNASLDHFLFGKNVSLDWHTRYNIIKGIARGLLYLHEDSRIRIVHRDLKGSNILLDSKLNPKIADFGMARLFHADQTHADTQRIAGTFGYMPPEYVYRGIFSVKSDVYSFGVLILEIIYGQRNSGILENDNMEDLITIVWRNWKAGTACDVVDLELVSASKDEIIRCIHIGLLCVQADPANRPTMSLVNLMLNSESQAMSVPSQPAYVLQKSMEVDPQSLYTTEDESITELHPR